MSPQQMTSTLHSVAGGSLCSDPDVLKGLAVQGVLPACVCTPGDEKEAGAVIQSAAAQRIQIVPFGGGTQQGIGRAPQAQFLALSTCRLNRLIHHEPGDMVATVQAGMELGAFQEAIGARGQWLPLDGNPKSTIGGLLATNYAGPRAYGYGTLRDMVLGMTVINGDGVARKCGGKVVKNVTGYALDKLYIGSLGTLGLVTEVTFKLFPKPPARWDWEIDLGNYEQGVELLEKIDAKNLPLEMLLASGMVKRSESPWIVRTSAAGTPIELARIERELGTLCDPSRIKRAERSCDWTDDELPAFHELEAGVTRVRFWCRRSALHSVLDYFCSQECHAEVSPTSGIALFKLNSDSAAKVAKELSALGANFQFENPLGSPSDQPFGPPRAEWALMRRVKLALDPHEILNTGRFVV
jgi:glycolate oxidase FAD binding subunit